MAAEKSTSNTEEVKTTRDAVDQAAELLAEILLRTLLEHGSMGAKSISTSSEHDLPKKNI